jgi:hypothetical protein
MTEQNTLRKIVLILIIILLGLAILSAGYLLVRMVFFPFAYGPGWMPFTENNLQQNAPYASPWGGMMGGGMMGGYNTGGLIPAEPLSIERAQEAAQSYLAQVGDENLAIKEIMIFDNHAYVEIIETNSGIGAMEVLVDPVSLNVYPEPGPNMMWNLKYGMMSGFGGNMMGGMMGRGGFQGFATPQDIEAEMPISPAEAIQLANQYLAQNLPGTQSADEADAFYGYYTLHVKNEAGVIGMLSVNGYNGQVFPHTWHGKFIEMTEEH